MFAALQELRITQLFLSTVSKLRVKDIITIAFIMTVYMQKEYKNSNFLSFAEENTKVTVSGYSKYTRIS